MTDSLLAPGRHVFRNVARTPNGLSNEHLVFGPYYLGILFFAGHRGGCGGYAARCFRYTRHHPQGMKPEEMTRFRERLFEMMREKCSPQHSHDSHDSHDCSDLNAVVVRLDFGMLREASQALAILLCALLDLRVKGLFHGVIMCAGIREGLGQPGRPAPSATQASQVQHVMRIGADWVFLYEPPETNPSVPLEFDRFMRDLARLQRHSPSLLQVRCGVV